MFNFIKIHFAKSILNTQYIIENRSKEYFKRFIVFGAGERTRTPDLRITNALLYRLSYTSILKYDPAERRTYALQSRGGLSGGDS